MPLNGLRWSHNSGSANCDMPQSVVFGRPGGGVNNPLPIEIKDGCWIGANSTILPGTVIEKGCVIAAGSVVKGRCRQDALYAGVPAKVIRELD